MKILPCALTRSVQYHVQCRPAENFDKLDEISGFLELKPLTIEDG